ncbi:conserved protein of unknown function [Limnospira indica PCC 8005]|uniref:Uncharacterized protein n=1 Tax=Limnospira indica PCC 8005 TaxID=376219 RepID=A0A9P1KEV4_9CYAN|nr:conserved protein of unknown function [Limnospira indica PCC 8005]
MKNGNAEYRLSQFKGERVQIDSLGIILITAQKTIPYSIIRV